MSRMHGSNSRVYLGGRDISGDIATITPEMACDTHDATTFASAGWKQADPGLLEWSAAWDGFYDPAVGGFGRQTETLLGGTATPLSIYEGDANAIGDTGVLFGNALVEKRGQPQSVADLIKLSGSIKGNGRVGYRGVLLHVLGQETITGTSASQNNTGSSANGGRGTLHVTAITGTWTIKIQHSINDADWSDLVTFTQVAAAGGVTAETSEVTGTVQQYLRVIFTEDVAGSITFAAGFARY